MSKIFVVSANGNWQDEPSTVLKAFKTSEAADNFIFECTNRCARYAKIHNEVGEGLAAYLRNGAKVYSPLYYAERKRLYELYTELSDEDRKMFLDNPSVWYYDPNSSFFTDEIDLVE